MPLSILFYLLSTIQTLRTTPRIQSARTCRDLAILREIRATLSESRRDGFKLCRLVTDERVRFPTQRYKCLDGDKCRFREVDDNAYVDVMRSILRAAKYVAVLCIPWIFPAFITVARKRRFATIGKHLWQKLDGAIVRIHFHKSNGRNRATSGFPLADFFFLLTFH